MIVTNSEFVRGLKGRENSHLREVSQSDNGVSNRLFGFFQLHVPLFPEIFSSSLDSAHVCGDMHRRTTPSSDFTKRPR